MFLTIVSFLDIEIDPFARQVVITIGSISGVSPIATDKANRNDFIQSPLVTPIRININGSNIIINLINTEAIDVDDISNLLLRSEL